MEKLKTKKSLLVILFTIFVDMLGVGILIPVIPLLLADPRSRYYLLSGGMDVRGGFVILGFLTAVYPLMMFLSAPILGQLSDIYGRRRILAVSLAGTFVSYLVFAMGIITRNIPLLFLSRMVDGITGGNIAVAQAAVADVTKPEERAKTFGLIGAVFGFGFIIGPYLGGKLSDHTIVSWFSAATPFWFAAILSFLNVLSVLLFFPETRLRVEERFVIRWGQSVHNIYRAFTTRGIHALFITSLLFHGGLSFLFTFFSVYLIRKFSFTQGNIGDYFAYIGLWVVITQAVITRAISKRFSEASVLRVTLLGCGIATFLFFLPGAWWGLLVVTPFFAVNNGLTQANMVSLISRSADSSIQGEVMGINASVQALAQAVPPILSGLVASQISPEAPIIVSSLIVGASWLFFMTSFRREQTASRVQ